MFALKAIFEPLITENNIFLAFGRPPKFWKKYFFGLKENPTLTWVCGVQSFILEHFFACCKHLIPYAHISQKYFALKMYCILTLSQAKHFCEISTYHKPVQRLLFSNKKNIFSKI
jgi:hypothetical protein